jgi:diadenosine tetraphosphate (Ap4A) HIT family hydrolase/predicted GIY-YIG superfamily endonuclease
MPYTYMLRCADGSYYTGWAVDLEARLKVHNQGKGGHYTRSRLPVELVYWEYQPDRSRAQHREAFIRKLKREQKEKLMAGMAGNGPATAGCPFCGPGAAAAAVARKGTVLAIEDRHPVTPGHLLIIPCRHTPDYFSMTLQEHRDALEIIKKLADKIKKADPSVTGFNIGANCGSDAGQTILHAHIHLIPRRRGDTASPRGGVRGVIPDKMSYPEDQ